MKNVRIIITFLLVLCFQPASGSAQEIAVVKSAAIKPYNEALRGFKSVCKSRVREFTLTGSNGPEILKKIRKTGPDLIYAIGLNALSQIRSIKEIPIIYSMVSNPGPLLLDRGNVTGVSMNVPAERQLRALIGVFPTAKRVGIVYDPGKTSHLFEEALAAASSLGISLVSREVHSSKDVPAAIRDMQGEIDAYWMLPDTTVFTGETIKYLFLTAFENKLPVVTFSERFVEKGSLMSLNIDALDIGRQAGEMASRVIRGAEAGNIQISSPRKAVLSVNQKAIERLGIIIRISELSY
jgi:putative ABC transport system substrate-binding protein